jgi:Predicted metal-dependent hydrolase
VKIIDLSHQISDNLAVFSGDEPPALKQTHFIDKDGYTNHQLSISMHVGTHIDGPWHMQYPEKHISTIEVDNFVGNACLIDIRGKEVFSDLDLLKQKSRNCSIILFYTGFSHFFGTSRYFSNYPVLDVSVAQFIASTNIKLIGFDSFSPDTAPYQIHKILFSRNVLIAENLTNMDQLIGADQFQVVALPLKVAADSAPARIIAIVE